MNATQLLEHFDRLAEAPGAVPRLRRFILDLAVRGKLVEQDAGDEPAAELLKRIQTERFRVLNKPVKRDALLGAEPESTDIQLPVGWVWSKLGNLCTKTGSGSTPAGGKDAYVSSGVPFLRSQNVYDDGLRLDGVAFISDATQERMSSTTIKAGDLLLNITGGSIGRCAIVPDSFVIGNINQHVAIIRLALPESRCFLHCVICSDYFQKHIFGNQTGAGREGLPKNRMDEILIPVAPLTEQHRIVAKVDELMALCDQLEAAQQERERRRERLAAASLQRLNQPAADTTPETQREHARFHLHHLPRLTTRPEHIKAMRQLLLDLAVRGKLLSQDSRDVPANELLQKIQQEKIKQPKGSNRTGVKLPPVDLTSVPFDLPSGWAWARFPEVGTFGRGKSKHRPRNDPSLYSDGTHLLIQTGDVARSKGVIKTFTSKYNDVGLAQSMKWPAGTLCITIAANIADSGILSFDACFPDSVVGFKPSAIFDSARYFEDFVRTAKANLLAFAPATAQKNINLEILNAVLTPLPPLAEQHRIVAKVDELMALCDQLETQLNTTQTDSRRLLEAVLETALVPA